MIVLIFALFLTLFSCEENKNDTNVAVEHSYADQESWNTDIHITNDGAKVGVIHAGHIKKYTKKAITDLYEDIIVDFFDEKGSHSSKLTAKGGRVYDRKQDMLAFGNVVVVSDSGITLYSDTLKWDNKKQKIISEIPVKFITKEDTLYGNSFISNPDLSNYEIENPHGSSSKRIKVD
jgi:LPS export ABC transporter protein LptC